MAVTIWSCSAACNKDELCISFGTGKGTAPDCQISDVQVARLAKDTSQNVAGLWWKRTALLCLEVPHTLFNNNIRENRRRRCMTVWWSNRLFCLRNVPKTSRDASRLIAKSNASHFRFGTRYCHVTMGRVKPFLWMWHGDQKQSAAAVTDWCTLHLKHVHIVEYCPQAFLSLNLSLDNLLAGSKQVTEANGLISCPQ